MFTFAFAKSQKGEMPVLGNNHYWLPKNYKYENARNYEG